MKQSSTPNLDRALRREFSSVYDNAYLAATTPVLATREQIVDAGVKEAGRIIQRWLLTREGLNTSVMLGYEAGKEAVPDTPHTG
jgi:hypothetical protein